MLLNHKNITIRSAGAGDAAQLAAWWNDGSVMAHAGFPLGLGTTPERVAEDLRSDGDHTRRRLMLLLDGRPIGEMCFKNLGGGTWDMGIKICEADYQEKGIGRVALSMLIAYLFRQGAAKIVLDTDLRNRRAQHVYEKLGFQKLRVNPDSWTDQLGGLCSSVDYELTAQDFHNFAVSY